MPDSLTAAAERAVVAGGGAAAILSLAAMGMGFPEALPGARLLGVLVVEGVMMAGGVAAVLWRWQPAVLEAVGASIGGGGGVGR